MAWWGEGMKRTWRKAVTQNEERRGNENIMERVNLFKVHSTHL
jgi:hypothetical protein